MKNGGELPECNIKMTSVNVKAKTRPLSSEARGLINEIKKGIRERMEAEALKNFIPPTMEERLGRMESMYMDNLPLALKSSILSNIISIRMKKILRDHCE